jgi:hypothetical protein
MSVKFNGTQQDIQDFLNMLAACMGLEAFLDANGFLTRAAGPPTVQNNAMANAFDNLTGLPTELTITVGKGQADVVGDNFAKREVDVDDLNKFPSPAPANFPNACTRCELLVHILAEYGDALSKGRTMGGQGYKKSHKVGEDAQNEHRAANGQEGRVASQSFKFRYSNGAATSVAITDGNITAVTHQN